MGEIGSGKTTFVNKVCNENLETQSGGQSVTQAIFKRQAAYGDSFEIADTPGTSVATNKLHHSVCLREALVKQELHSILIAIKYERIDLMTKTLMQQLIPITGGMKNDFLDMVTVIVTHFDTCGNDPKKSFYEVKERIKKQFGIQSLICVGIKADPNILCKAVYQNLCLRQPKKIDISEEDLARRFDLKDDQNFSLMIDMDSISQQVEAESKSFIKFIEEYKDDDKDEVMHAIQVNIKLMVEEKIQQFTADHQDQMDKADCYIHYMQLKFQLMPHVQKVLDLASSKMSYSLLDQNDPRNKFKRCPQCGEIWIKTAGCNGNTTCGNRLQGDERKDKLSSNIFLRYVFKFFGKQLKVEKIEQNKQDEQQQQYQQQQQQKYQSKSNSSFLSRIFEQFGINQNQSNQTQNQSNRTQNQPQQDLIQTKGKGCGASFNWGDLPALEENLLREILNSGLKDYLANQQNDQEQEDDFFRKYNEARYRVEYK